MTDLWTSPSEEEQTASRRRALWGLTLLVAIAVLVIALMLLVFGRSPSGRGSQGVPAAVATTAANHPGPTTGGTLTHSSTETSPVPSPSPSATTRPAQTSTASPCPSTAPCVVGGDDGGVIAALNALRTSHGLAAVPGAPTGPAQECALSQGDGPTCVPHYAWQPVPVHDGATVISAIAGRAEGAAWLLDPNMTSFSVGWAYAPGGAGAPGQYECAILKIG
jgi:hypothetical protein